MLLNKVMLMGGGGVSPPEPGYVKARLTIEKFQSFPMIDAYGFSSAQNAGALVPSNNYSYLYFDTDKYNAVCSRPFYYEGSKYMPDEGVSSSDPMYRFSYMEGQTVDVWLAPE